MGKGANPDMVDHEVFIGFDKPIFLLLALRTNALIALLKDFEDVLEFFQRFLVLNTCLRAHGTRVNVCSQDCDPQESGFRSQIPCMQASNTEVLHPTGWEPMNF